MSVLRVRDLMRSPPCSITPMTTLPDIERRLQAYGVRRLPVMDRRWVVGIVTLGDVRHAQPSDVPLLHTYEQPARLAGVHALDLMSQPVISIPATAPVTDAVRLMLKHKISGVPVLRGGQLVGMITASDIFRAIVGDTVTSNRARVTHDTSPYTPNRR